MRILAVDFDGTLCEADGGPPKLNVVDAVGRLRDRGWFIRVTSAREMLGPVVEWLDKHNAPYDEVVQKPRGECYLDDRQPAPVVDEDAETIVTMCEASYERVKQQGMRGTPAPAGEPTSA